MMPRPRRNQLPARQPEAYVDKRRSLNIASGAADYNAANTLYAPASSRVNLQVTNAGCYYQLGSGVSPDSIVWGIEVALVPGKYSFDRTFDAVRIKNLGAVACVVTIETMTPEDIGWGNA